MGTGVGMGMGTDRTDSSGRGWGDLDQHARRSQGWKLPIKRIMKRIRVKDTNTCIDTGTE